MKFILSIILIAVLSAVAEYLLPWWSAAAVSFLVSLFMVRKGGAGFLAGFLGVALMWFVAALLQDMANEHILSTRMAVLFHLPDYKFFIGVTALVGGLVGGLAGWAGALLPLPFAPKKA